MKTQELEIGQEAINPAPTLEEIIKWQEEQIKNLEPKALTDEEILDEWMDEPLNYDGEREIIDFARAILRKARNNG